MLARRTYSELRIEPKDRAQMDRYYNLACRTFENSGRKDLPSSDTSFLWYGKGINLWGKLLDRFLELRDSDNPSERERVMAAERLSDDNKALLLERFLGFASKHGFTLESERRVRFCVGEGDSLRDSAPAVMDAVGRRLKDLRVDLMCGPVMVSNDHDTKNPYDCLNDFVAALVKFYNSSARRKNGFDLNIRVNKFPSLVEGFCGYFHVYLLGDVILFENMHKLAAETQSVWFVIVDGALAEKVNRHFDSYSETFTRKANVDNLYELVDSLQTYTRTNYKRTFDNYHIDNLMKMTGC